MKKVTVILIVAAGFWQAGSSNIAAQTNVVTLTNVVTVTVTNIVTVTNTVALAAPATNAAGPVVQPPKYPWKSSIGAGFTLTRGNSQTLLATGNILTERKTPLDEVHLGADGAYGVNNSVKDVDTVHAFGQYNHLFTDQFYGYMRIGALHDGVADLQYRVTVGPGLGYYLLKETNITFAVEGGGSYVNERLGSVEDNYATLRLADRFEYKFKHYGARFWENTEILPQINKFENYLVNAEVGIESSLTKKLSLKVYLVDNFNNVPAAGRQKNDLKLISGVSYKF